MKVGIIGMGWVGTSIALEPELDDDERAALERSAQVLRQAYVQVE